MWNRIKTYFRMRPVKKAHRRACKPILTGNAKALRTECKNVGTLKEGDDIIFSLILVGDNINRAAGKHPGMARCVGLAANQIGIYKRVFIVMKNGGGWRSYVNPVIIGQSAINIPRIETCFSNKHRPVEVMRSKWVIVKSDEMLTTKKLHGLEAWAFQHEMDHMRGIIRK